MNRLVLFFLPGYLKNWGLVFLGLMGLQLFSRKLGISEDALVGLPLFLLITVSFGSLPIMKNLSWIRSLPLKKTEVVGAIAILWWLNAVLMLAVMTAYFWIFQTFHPMPLVEGNGKKFGLAGVFELILGVFPLSSNSWMAVFSVIGVFFLTAFAAGEKSLVRGQWWSFAPMKFKMQGLAVIGFGSVLLNLSDSPFLVGGALIIVFWTIFQFSITSELALYRDSKKWVLGLVICCVALQLGFVYQRASKELNDYRPEVVSEAIDFLGGLAPTGSQLKVIDLLDKIEDESVLYGYLEHHSELLKASNLEAWLMTKKNPRLLSYLEGRVKGIKLNADSIRKIVGHYDDIKKELDANTFYNLLQGQFTAKDSTEFLKASGPYSFGLGLFLCRRYLNQDCTLWITERLKKVSENNPSDWTLIRLSLLTLSILKAKWLYFDFYARLKTGQNVNSDLGIPEVDCERYHHHSIQGTVSYTEAAPLNYCIRKHLLEVHPERAPRDAAWVTGELKTVYADYFKK